jgi:hypothetical protein
LRWDGHDGMVFVLPDKGLLGVLSSAGNWFPLPSDLTDRIRRATEGVTPFPFRLTKATVNHRRAADPSAYVPLLAQGAGGPPATSAYTHARRWITIELAAYRETPWTWGTLRLNYDPVLKAAAAATSYTWTPVPAALANRIEADAGLAPPPSRATSSFPWWWAALTLTAAAIALLMHERRGRSPFGSSVRWKHRRKQARPPG